MEQKQTTISDIIDAERLLVVDAPKRYGACKLNWQGSTRQIENFDLHGYMASGAVELSCRIDVLARSEARSSQAETTAFS